MRLLFVVLVRFSDTAFLGFLLFFLVFFFGDDVEAHGVDLNHFELDVALRAAQDFAFFNFIFVHINFGVALRTSDHGEILLPELNVEQTGVLYTQGVKHFLNE